MKQFVWCLITALIIPVLSGCSEEFTEEEEKQSIQAMEEESKKMEELLPAKVD
ncbi:hypothetical protein [Gimesia aquarii]|uniref:Uncharacterized protein n=1 Tax=Gimesia aquarii TaxID=2527964 RepID=A0A517VS96_9PLAN|nr:hypothetical protein [Gimesia aquarii]QDT95873.1 hypothetical protein V144x_13210 [Gimesia aquarii]